MTGVAVKKFTPEVKRAINAQTKLDEAEITAQLEGFGWKWIQLDLPTNSAKRPEGCVVIDGNPAMLVEVKRAFSGGMSTDGTVMLSEFDPDLAGAGVKEFPGIPPTVDPQLEHAREKYADLVRDHPEYAGLPYVVIYLASSFVSLDLVDRKMPTRRELSGLVFAVRGRRWKEACAAISMEEFERRFDEKDFAGFPDPNETEWRLVANPYAHRPVPTAFSNVCLPGWPKDVPFPDSITPADDARAKAALASLDGDEKMALEAIWYSYGRLDAKRKEWRPIDAAVDKLIARRLARAVADHVFELTTEGLLCALVKDAPL